MPSQTASESARTEAMSQPEVRNQRADQNETNPTRKSPIGEGSPAPAACAASGSHVAIVAASAAPISRLSSSSSQRDLSQSLASGHLLIRLIDGEAGTARQIRCALVADATQAVAPPEPGDRQRQRQRQRQQHQQRLAQQQRYEPRQHGERQPPAEL